MSENRELIKFTKLTLLTPRRKFFMNKNFVGIFAVSVVALASSIIAAPAEAVTQDVDVQVTISPTLYLRTFKTIDLQITNSDLGAIDKDFMGDTGTTGSAITNGTGLIDRTPPNFGVKSITSINKTVSELFAVWSNSQQGVNVTVTPVVDGISGKAELMGASSTNTGKKITLKSVTTTTASGTPTLDEPFVGDATLTFDVTKAPAGLYNQGKIRVEATPKF
jgi:hypothetical protein